MSDLPFLMAKDKGSERLSIEMGAQEICSRTIACSL